MDGFDYERVGDDVVLSLDGDLDLARVPDVVLISARALAAARLQARRIVVDLARVAFMDSVALGALIALRNDADRTKIRFAVRDLQPRVRRLLELTGLSEFLAVEPPAATHISDGGDR